jgi:hypothetical protein
MPDNAPVSEPWGAIDPHSWQSTPCVAGRAATRDDVVAGRAVFFVDGPSTPYAMPLPACARVQLEDGSSANVVVIQAEQGPEGIFVGIRAVAGGTAICELCEIEVLGTGF